MFGNRGQVTILALLLGLLGLTVGLSVAARSLSDFRQVTVVDQGTKALAAADAGVQYALNQVSQGAITSNCTDYVTATGLNLTGIKEVKYNLCAGTANYVSFPAVPQDDVIQVKIGGQSSNVKSFKILWKNPNTSIEVIKINVDNSSGQVSQTRYLYNGTGSDPGYLSKTSGNAFASSEAGQKCVAETGNALCADSSYNSGSCGGYWGEIPYGGSGGGDQYLRVKPLYGSTDLTVCNTTTGNSSGSLSVLQVTALATTQSNVVKKVQARLVPSSLPAVFDNVFYSSGNLAK